MTKIFQCVILFFILCVLSGICEYLKELNNRPIEVTVIVSPEVTKLDSLIMTNTQHINQLEENVTKQIQTLNKKVDTNTTYINRIRKESVIIY